MKKIKLAQGTWVEISNKKHGPGDIIEVDDKIAESLISGGSATEEIEKHKIKEVNDANKNTQGSNSGKA